MGYRKGRFSFEEKNYALNFHCAKNGIFCWGFLQQMWANPQFLVDLVTFTEEILNGNGFCNPYVIGKPLLYFKSIWKKSAWKNVVQKYAQPI